MLHNIRVLDIGRYVAGPYCAALLGSLGAEVIRVEKPSGGEDRFISPLTEAADGTPGEGGLFMQTAYGKKSVTLNLGTPEGRDLLVKLALSADIIVANMPLKALSRLKLDWDSLEKVHPSCILVTQSAFGDTGPDADKGGFDGVAQALSGAMYLTGDPGNPVKAGAPYVDYATAVMSAFATLAALIQKQETGKGQHVQTSLLGTALSVMNAHLAEQAVTCKNRIGTGNRVQTSAPSDVFATIDGHVLIHTVGDNIFAKWAKMVGRPELIDDPRCQGDQKRGDNRDFLCDIMQGWCAGKNTDTVLQALETAGVPCGPVYSMQEALDSPQVAAMNFFKAVSVPGTDKTAPVVGLPASFSAFEPAMPETPPTIGADTQAVLAELGVSIEDIRGFKDKGIV